VGLLFRDRSAMMTAHSLKGLAFVLVTSFLLYLTIARYVRSLTDREAVNRRQREEKDRAEEELRSSGQMFTDIFQMSPDAIDITELATGRMLACNQSYVKMYGYSRDELIGHSTLPGDLGVWARAEDRTRHVAELEARGTVLGFEAPARRKDGSTFIAMISSSVLEIRGKHYNLSLSRDITVQKRAEEALRERSRRLQLATEAGRLGIWDRNLEDGTVIWSDLMFELNGLQPGAEPPSFEQWCRTSLHPEDRAATVAAIEAAIAGKGGYDLEFRVLHPDGGVHHVKSNGRILRNREGRAVRIIGIHQDRTRQVEAEAEYRRLQAELQHAEKLDSIGSLAGGVAHDMNNVLAAIMGMASAMRTAYSGTEFQAASLDTIIRACGRGRDVVKSLLYFARKDLEAVGPVDLNIIAQEVIHLLSYTTLSRVRVETDFHPDLGLVQGDAAALSHALINLCVNAVDAMPDGGSLQIRTDRHPRAEITLSVQDTGHGMSPEVARKAVEPFFTTKPQGKGTGLGLAMVYGTMKAHKGTLRIRSQPDQGTEVILGFPPLPGTPADGDPVPAPQPPAQRTPLRILLVDDDELIRMAVTPMLTSLGHEVHTAEGGAEALERLRGGLQVDLVVLDMNMPGLNGAQTLERLLELRPAQKVLMATGYSDDSLAPLLEGRPGVFSLRKPFSLGEIRTKLEGIDGLGAAT
jgi:PAS domain S-box-containing protein